jgi:hypothetical protein
MAKKRGYCIRIVIIVCKHFEVLTTTAVISAEEKNQEGED